MVQELNSPGEEQEAHYSHLCVLREGSRCPYSQRESGIREGWILRDSFCYHPRRPIRGCTVSGCGNKRESQSVRTTEYIRVHTLRTQIFRQRGTECRDERRLLNTDTGTLLGQRKIRVFSVLIPKRGNGRVCEKRGNFNSLFPSYFKQWRKYVCVPVKWPLVIKHNTRTHSLSLRETNTR